MAFKPLLFLNRVCILCLGFMQLMHFVNKQLIFNIILIKPAEIRDVLNVTSLKVFDDASVSLDNSIENSTQFTHP